MNQPIPAPNNLPHSWDLVIEDMKARDLVGVSRYGTPLQPFNGRDSLLDLSDELMDGIVYLRNFREEMASLGRELTDVADFLDEATIGLERETITRAVTRLDQILNSRPSLKARKQ